MLQNPEKTFAKLIKISTLLQKGDCKSTDSGFTVVRPEQYLEMRKTRVLQDHKNANFEPCQHLRNRDFLRGGVLTLYEAV